MGEKSVDAIAALIEEAIDRHGRVMNRLLRYRLEVMCEVASGIAELEAAAASGKRIESLRKTQDIHKSDYARAVTVFHEELIALEDQLVESALGRIDSGASGKPALVSAGEVSDDLRKDLSPVQATESNGEGGGDWEFEQFDGDPSLKSEYESLIRQLRDFKEGRSSAQNLIAAYNIAREAHADLRMTWREAKRDQLDEEKIDELYRQLNAFGRLMRALGEIRDQLLDRNAEAKAGSKEEKDFQVADSAVRTTPRRRRRRRASRRSKGDGSNLPKAAGQEARREAEATGQNDCAFSVEREIIPLSDDAISRYEQDLLEYTELWKKVDSVATTDAQRVAALDFKELLDHRQFEISLWKRDGGYQGEIPLFFEDSYDGFGTESPREEEARSQRGRRPVKRAPGKEPRRDLEEEVRSILRDFRTYKPSVERKEFFSNGKIFLTSGQINPRANKRRGDW